MPIDPLAFVLLAIFFAVAFAASRFLKARWRNRQRAREEQAARAGESRQVRRARERQERR